MQEKKPLVEESWSIKRIIIGLVLLIFVVAGLYGLKTYVLDKNNQTEKQQIKSVKGTTTQKEELIKTEELKTSLNIPKSEELKAEAQKKLDEIKQEVSTLQLDDVASSSPQIQKVLNDIKALEQYPRNQVKDTCLKICDGIK